MSMTTHPRIDGNVHHKVLDTLPEILDPWRDAINDAIHAEEAVAYYVDLPGGELSRPVKELRIPDQPLRLDVSNCDIVPREVRGYKHGLAWVAYFDFDASFEIANYMRRYIAIFMVVQG